MWNVIDQHKRQLLWTVVQYSVGSGYGSPTWKQDYMQCRKVKYSRCVSITFFFSGSLCGWIQMCGFQLASVSVHQRKRVEGRGGSKPDKDIQLAWVYGRPLHQSEHAGAGWHKGSLLEWSSNETWYLLISSCHCFSNFPIGMSNTYCLPQ